MDDQAEIEEVAEKAAAVIGDAICDAGSEVTSGLVAIAESLEHVAIALESASAADATQNIATVLDDNLRRIGSQA